MPSPETGDLVILIRPRDSQDPMYANKWVGQRVDVLATHQKVVNAINKAKRAGRDRVFIQLSPGSKIIGSTTIGDIRGRGDSILVTFTNWQAMDSGPAGRSYGSSFYWVK